MDAEPTSGAATEAAIQAASAYVVGRNFRAAVDVLGEGLRTDPESASLLRLRGYYLSFLDRHAEAEADGRRAVALGPLDPQSHRLLGAVLTQIKRKRKEALRHLLEAVRLAPEDGWSHYHLAVLRAVMLRPRLARASFAAACEHCPDEPVILATAAEYAFALRRAREGTDLAARAFRADPTSGLALAAQARSRLLAGRREEALDLARASLAIDATYPRALEVLFEAELGGRWDRAIWLRVRTWVQRGRLRGALLIFGGVVLFTGFAGALAGMTDLAPVLVVGLLVLFQIWAFLPLKRIQRRTKAAAKPFVLAKEF